MNKESDEQTLTFIAATIISQLDYTRNNLGT